MKQLAANIRSFRTAKQWSQAQMAAKLHISAAAYSKIENAQTDLNYARLQQIAKVLDMGIIALIQGQQEVQADELVKLRQELLEKEREINKLRKKVIDLYEKLDL